MRRRKDRGRRARYAAAAVTGDVTVTGSVLAPAPVPDMTFPRRLRSLIALLVAMAFVLSQGVVSAYACGATGETPAAAAATCEGMDASQPVLCHEHCHPSPKNADATPAPLPAATAPLLLVAMPLPQPVIDTGVPLAGPGRGCAAPALDDASPPPLAVLHCVWRN